MAELVGGGWELMRTKALGLELLGAILITGSKVHELSEGVNLN